MTDDELEDKVDRPLLLEVVVNPGNSGMGHRREQRGFAMEIGEPELPEFCFFGSVEHLLDGAGSIDRGESEIASLVDGAHATDAKHIEHPVTILENRAEFEEMRSPRNG